MTDIPFATMLESGIKQLIEGKAKNAVLCGKLEDGSTLTAFADMEAEDMAAIAFHILSTAFMDVVLNNIEMVKEALEACEDDEGDECDG